VLNKKTKLALKELRKFAVAHDLVEFGHLKENDEVSPVGGITLHKNRHDLFYAHGHANGRDTSFLLRNFNLGSTTAKSTQEYTWVIVKLKLSVENLPHIFIDAHQADNELYRHLIEILGTFTHVTDALREVNTSFSSHFHVFAKLDISFLLEKYLHDNLMQAMFEHYQGISFELAEDELFIYLDKNNLDSRMLTKMLEAGLWLSEQMEYAHAEVKGYKE